MGTTRRRVDGSHPLTQFCRRLNGELRLVYEAICRDRGALDLLERPGLPLVLERLEKLDRMRADHEDGDPLQCCPRRWTRRDEKRLNHIRETLGGDVCTPDGRTARVLRFTEGPRGSERPRLRFYHAALQRLTADGTAAALSPLLLDAREALEAFIAEAAEAASEGREPPLSWQRATNAIGRLGDELPRVKDEPRADPETQPAKQETKAKPGPKTEADEERQRYRILLAWEDFQKDWPKWKKRCLEKDDIVLKGIPLKNREFYLWCEVNGRDIPKVKHGESLNAKGKWHKRIEDAIHAAKANMKRKNLKTLEEYGKDLRRRGVL